ncbi:MAG TPA: hypothetical protein VJ896_05525 [Bacteroidales bacterium]|nr:hypothetical protein [Bacteroidales bacterium]
MMKNKKTLLLIVTFLMLGTISGFSVNLNKTQSDKKDIPQQDTLKTNPKIDIKVNKAYDDKGDIIRYNSNYSYI